MMEGQLAPILGILAAVGLLSVIITPRVRTADGFFRGWSDMGAAPGVFTLTLSQVTTWIFARSLLNAGILGYYYGVAGALAYAAYYGSFVTGWLIIDRLRFHHGADNVQSFLRAHFGRLGSGCFNGLVSLRLLSEVFANLLVVGIVFEAVGGNASTAAILGVAAVTLLYSMTGGLRGSLRTDVLQMGVLAILIAGLFVTMLGHPGFSLDAVIGSSPDLAGPGWVLLAVALLQVWSYPLHDPVMMDRGFIADRRATRSSFLHAAWISTACILAFGVLGVFAGLNAAEGEALIESLGRLLGGPAAMMLALALVISAASTLDSTLSSAAKLAVKDMGLAKASAGNGRLAMLAFALGGLLLVFVGTDDLFAAVAVSGTASLFLTPVIVYCIWGGRTVARWSFAVAFAAAVTGAVLYFVENAGYVGWLQALTGLEHKYSRLLFISASVLAIGLGAFGLGLRRRDAGA